MANKKLNQRFTDLKSSFLASFTVNMVDKTGQYPRLDKDLPVFIKELTATDFSTITGNGGTVTMLPDGSKTLDLSTVKGGDALLVQLCLCADANGTKYFRSPKELDNIPLDVLRPIAQDIRKLSGLSDDDDLLDDSKND